MEPSDQAFSLAGSSSLPWNMYKNIKTKAMNVDVMRIYSMVWK